MIDLDTTDRLILRLLSEDATQSASAIGRRLGLSQPAAWRRIRKLHDAGVIKGQRLDLDPEKLGFGVTVFLGVKLATKGRVSLEDFERAVSAIPRCRRSSISSGCTITACGWLRATSPISSGCCAAGS